MIQNIAGSEKFAYRPSSRAEILKKVPAKLRLHSVDQRQVAELDPLTYEVIRHRLWAITEEMGEAIKRMSGSVVVTDCNDFDCAMTDELGDEVQVGLYNAQLCASMDMAVKWTLENRAVNPGIAEGDMFLCNDPWVGGGLHQNDASLFAPFFWEGELVAWTCAVAHQVDVGGVSPGSWTPRSEDVFWESLPTPPIKLVEGYQLRADIEDAFLRRSRMPKLLALDLRAMMGANNVAHERLTLLIRKYGTAVVKAVMYRVMDDAEERLRAKLRDLPDGIWHSVSYQDQAKSGDRGLYKVVLAMTKRDDRLIFDFHGTDPQVVGMINCTYAGMRAGVLAIVMMWLCGDIPWAPGGIERCLEFISEDGTLNNCTFPSGISKASVGSTWATHNATIECIAAMLDMHPTYRQNAMSICTGTWDLILLSGVDQHDNGFVTMLCDPMAGGMGARSDQDGVDTGGGPSIPMGRAADVEMNEFQFPILYLWRREEVDSGGPGRFRGGLGASSCFMIHDSSLRTMGLVVSNSGKAVPLACGSSGGYPANTSYDVAVRNSNVRELLGGRRWPRELEDLSGTFDYLPPECDTQLGWNDVYYTSWQGGGGYGDPMLRDPERVARDLAERKVSPAAARNLYGVVLDDHGQVAAEATLEQRRQLRMRRAGSNQRPPQAARPAESGWSRIDDNLMTDADGRWCCAHCGTVLAERGRNYLDGALIRHGHPSEAGPQIRGEPEHFVDQRIIFRQFYCPGCYVALLTEVVPSDETQYRRKELSPPQPSGGAAAVTRGSTR
ncbi:MAG TPA: hydantoinase B/oxoprolinase family protein [Candidatus Binataceae bacterium]|nr:hydantoinase B/oxoprolinase family protein [Candidatus Binataceae bacterium]